MTAEDGRAPAAPAATTRVAAVIGDPVHHSLSPALHNAAYRAAGLDWVYVAFEVPEGGAAGALSGARALGLAGLNVTMPHKSAIASHCDVLAGDAAILGSVNTIVPRADRWEGHSTDGEGFLLSLREAGHDPQGRRVLVVGAGGAGRAVALALGRAGARVAVTARRTEAATRAATAVPDGRAVPWADRSGAVRDADLVVNATPLGMAGAGDMAVDPADLSAGQVVADLVYHPRVTPLLAAAAQRGLATVGGLGMLVHQAAVAFELFTGTKAPIGAMWDAVTPDGAG